MPTLDSPVIEPRLLHELVLRCASRDEAALAEYYRLTSPMLNAVVSRRGGSEQEVESVLVNLYVAIWRQAGRYAALGDPSVWEWTMTILEQTLQQTMGKSTSRWRRSGD